MKITKTQNKRVKCCTEWQIYALVLVLFLLPPSMRGQVTVGDGTPPQDFSILEVVSNGTGGFRLPRLTNGQRQTLEESTAFQTEIVGKGKGLTIYNTSVDCVEYWNGIRWISICTGGSSFIGGDCASSNSPAGGETIHCEITDSNCLTDGEYVFTIVSGADYISLRVIDAGAGEFDLTFEPNDRASDRQAIVMVTSPCGTSEFFVYTQKGDDIGCGTTTVPAIKSLDDITAMCSGGAVYLYLEGYPAAGTYIWTLNGQQVGTGYNYTATQPGKYIVYGDKIGCDNSRSIRVTLDGTGAPSPISIIVRGNNGLVCGAGGTTTLIASSPASGIVRWFKDGVLQPLTSPHNEVEAGVGSWFAVVSDGSCWSTPSETVTVSEALNCALGIQLSGGSVNAAGQTELVFVSAVGIAPASQPLTVSWQPNDADLIVSSMVIGANGFPSGVGEPHGNIVGGNGGTGTVTYTIQPAGFTALEVDESQGGNPFLEKVSKVDFTTTNGISYATASVFLRQINYNLLTDVRGGYMLNAQTETLKVRANFSWTITAVADPDNILQDGSSLVGRTGGNNTTTGDAVNFTMVAKDLQAPKIGKTATITFSRRQDGSTWDVVITAEEALYVGYFGGALVATIEGVWQFQYPLYVQSEDESEGSQWKTSNTNSPPTNEWYGKNNTYKLNSTAHPAAYLCMQKNGVAISSVYDPNYNWYLPAQQQLMAIWVAHASFESQYQFNSTFLNSIYWSSTKGTWDINVGVRYVNFGNGTSSYDERTNPRRVRCVRELP